ncbi:MAG: TraR/DksA C4-type zinc finger protein, partial [Actinobacteria bacterium]|nr:TraR/DksA C4-type zinc finger protein [Actinomycetota bacterium]
YGTCEACGKVIDEARLEALPAARFCLDDQSKAEREARAGS